jgi:hypothetical protein
MPLLLACVHLAEAQQLVKVPRIGYLSGNFPSAIVERTEAFRQGLRELGYVEGKNIAIESRYAEGKLEHLPTLAAELVRLNVAVIVTVVPASATLLDWQPLRRNKLELLKESVPKLSRAAVLGTSTQPGNAQALNTLLFLSKNFLLNLLG